MEGRGDRWGGLVCQFSSLHKPMEMGTVVSEEVPVDLPDGPQFWQVADPAVALGLLEVRMPAQGIPTDSALRVSGLRFEVSDFWLWLSGLRLWVQGSGFLGAGFLRVLDVASG